MPEPTDSASVDPTSPEELAATEGFERGGPTRPLARDRRSPRVAAAYGIVVAGVALIILTLIDGPGASTTALSLIAGLLVVALGAATLAGLIGPRPAGAIGLVGGVALGITGLVPSAIGLEEVGRLASGAVLFMSSAGILASSRRS